MPSHVFTFTIVRARACVYRFACRALLSTRSCEDLVVFFYLTSWGQNCVFNAFHQAKQQKKKNNRRHPEPLSIPVGGGNASIGSFSPANKILPEEEEAEEEEERTENNSKKEENNRK